MGARFRNVDRDTPLLIPPDLREWVADDDMARFILEVVSDLDLSAAVINQRGTGDAQYPPGMMLAVLLYCYSHGIMSSRQIEMATYRLVSVRFLSGDLHPDHDTVATFRRRNGPLIRSAFQQLLLLARRVGVLQLGTVALDGTKLAGVASKRHTLNRPALEAELLALDAQIATLLAQAEAADAAGGSEGERLPPELASAAKRREKLRAAQQALLAEERARIAAAAPPAPGTVRAPEEPRSRPHQPPPAARQRVNVVEPESRLLKTAHGFVQGYNAQLVVEASVPCGLILAAEVVACQNDFAQLAPMVEQVIANVGEAPGCVLVDSGYENYAHCVRLQKRHGVEVLLPPGRRPQARATAQPRKEPRAHRDRRQ